MNTVYGLDYYQNVRYGLVTDDGRTGIEVELDERAWGPNYLQLGMEYSSAADSDALFGLAASYLRTAINPLGGEWRTTIVIGDEPALITDLYQPFGAEGSVLLRAVAASRVESVQRLRRRRARHGGAAARGDARVRRRARAADVGRVPVRRAGRQGRIQSARRRSELHLRGRFPARRVLRPLLRRHDGQRLVSARGLARHRSNGALSRAAAARGRRGLRSAACSSGAYAKTWGRHTVLTTLRYDATISGEAVRQPAVPHGRVLRHLGHQPQSALGPARGARGSELLPAHRRSRAVSGVRRHEHRARQRRGSRARTSPRATASSAARSGPASSTPVGPVYVGYGRAEGGEDAFYISLGRVF